MQPVPEVLGLKSGFLFQCLPGGRRLYLLALALLLAKVGKVAERKATWVETITNQHSSRASGETGVEAME